MNNKNMPGGRRRTSPTLNREGRMVKPPRDISFEEERRLSCATLRQREKKTSEARTAKNDALR